MRVKELEKNKENSEMVSTRKNVEMASGEQKRGKSHEGKERESSEMRDKTKVNFFAKENELKKAINERQQMVLLVYKESFLNFEEPITPLPSLAISLL